MRPFIEQFKESHFYPSTKETIMIKRATAVLAILCLIGLTSTAALAVDKMSGQQKSQTHKTDSIYGHELMTPEQRTDYRNKLRSLKTDQERNAYRMEHQKRIHKLAKAKGIPLSDKQSSPVDGMGGYKEGSGR
jgi:hypothetical protein